MLINTHLLYNYCGERSEPIKIEVYDAHFVRRKVDPCGPTNRSTLMWIYLAIMERKALEIISLYNIQG